MAFWMLLGFPSGNWYIKTFANHYLVALWKLTLYLWFCMWFEQILYENDWIISPIKCYLFSFFSRKSETHSRGWMIPNHTCKYAGLCGFSTLMIPRSGRINLNSASLYKSLLFFAVSPLQHGRMLKERSLICLFSISMTMSMSILSMEQMSTLHYINIAYRNRIRLRILAFICWKSNLFDHLENSYLVMNFWNHKSNANAKNSNREYDRVEHTRRRNTNKNNTHTHEKKCGSILFTLWRNILLLVPLTKSNSFSRIIEM